MLFSVICLTSSLVFLLVGYNLGVRDKTPIRLVKKVKHDDTLMQNLEAYDGTSKGQKII